MFYAVNFDLWRIERAMNLIFLWHEPRSDNFLVSDLLEGPNDFERRLAEARPVQISRFCREKVLCSKIVLVRFNALWHIALRKAVLVPFTCGYVHFSFVLFPAGQWLSITAAVLSSAATVGHQSETNWQRLRQPCGHLNIFFSSRTR